MFGRIPLWSHFVLVINVFSWSISSWFSFGGIYISRKLSISSRFSNLLAYNCSWYFLMFFCISVVAIEIFPFSFLILFIWILSFLFLVSLARGLSMLSTLSKYQLLVLLIFSISILLISSLILIISFLLLTSGFVCSSFSSSLGGRRSCQFEIFLLCWGRPVLLLTSL